MAIHAVIDFETTGMAPDHGARPTEIGIVLIDEGIIVARYQSLMNPGQPIPYEIQALTGITNAMVRQAPPVEKVMAEAADFVGEHPLVAHNAAFDRKFWDHELENLGRRRQREFACSLLLARRVFPDAPNHKLITLVQHLGLPATGRYHRALADAEATAHLLHAVEQALQARYGLAAIEHELLLAIQQTNRRQLDACIQRHLATLL